MEKARALLLVVLLVPVLAAPTPIPRTAVWAGDWTSCDGGPSGAACPPCGETAPCGPCPAGTDGDGAASCDLCVCCQCGIGVLAFTCSLPAPAGITAPPAPGQLAPESIARAPSPPPPKSSTVKS